MASSASSTEKMGQFTWQQIAEHNTESSAWVYIDRKVYDLSKWMYKHPGGKNIVRK